MRIDSEIKKRPDALSKQSKPSKSCLVAESYRRLRAVRGMAGELQAGIAELDSGQEVSHKRVSQWLRSWGKPREAKAPQWPKNL